MFPELNHTHKLEAFVKIFQCIKLVQVLEHVSQPFDHCQPWPESE